jgi:AAA domain
VSAGHFRLCFLEEILMLPPPQWLIDGLLQTDTLAVLYGPPKAGKSFLAFDLALSVAAGRPSLGHEVKQGDVLYVSAEGGNGVSPRVRAWLAKRGPMPSTASRFALIRRPVNIRDGDGDVEALISDIRAARLNPSLIVIDTLARCYGGGNENSQQDMGVFVAGCDRLREMFPGTTVLVVHHKGWEASHERGSNALRGAVDTVIAVDRMDGFTRMEVKYHKDAAVDGKAALMLLENVALDENTSSCVLQHAETSRAYATERERPKGRQTPTSDTAALSVLDTAGAAGLTVVEWCERSGLPRTTLNDARKRLSKRGEARKVGDRWFASVAPADGMTDGANDDEDDFVGSDGRTGGSKEPHPSPLSVTRMPLEVGGGAVVSAMAE